jgi:hypothetical protein
MHLLQRAESADIRHFLPEQKQRVQGISASSFENSTDSASVLISQSLREVCLETRLDIVSHDNKKFKLGLTKRRTVLVKIIGLKDKTTGGERLCYDPRGYVTYTPPFSHFITNHIRTNTSRTNVGLGPRHSRTNNDLTLCRSYTFTLCIYTFL